MTKGWLKKATVGVWMTGIVGAGLVPAVAQADYSQHQKAAEFVSMMVSKHGFERQALEQWLAAAEKKQNILDAIARPAEKTKPWHEYRQIFLTPDRIEKGVNFWVENRATLEKAEQEYGVPPEMVVAIIGVETRYGIHKGSYRVMDALSTLAFDYPPRSTFFSKELEHFLLLAREQKHDPLTLSGSYAGAMGYGQFMPSSYRSYAVDFDGDGFTDIWDNPVDAIGSVANYFKRHGWKAGEPVVSRVRLGKNYDPELVSTSLKPANTVDDYLRHGFTPLAAYPADAAATLMRLDGENGAEYWMGLNNFYAITRYNHSQLYAMAVYQLSQSIKEQFAGR